MDSKHHCNECPYWFVTKKKYPSGYYDITLCRKYNEQLYYLAGEENKTPHPCNICSEELFYVPYIEFERNILRRNDMGTNMQKIQKISPKHILWSAILENQFFSPEKKPRKH